MPHEYYVSAANIVCKFIHYVDMIVISKHVFLLFVIIEIFLQTTVIDPV